MALKKISEGAEADIYELELLGIKAVMKYRRPKPYLVKEIEEYLRDTRTRTEARILSKVSSLISAPKPLLVTRYAIIMQKLEGIQASKNPSLGKPGAEASGKALAALHSSGIIHGDFTTANILVGRSGISVIDFGLSYYSSSAEDMAFDILLFKRSVSKEDFRAFEEAYGNGFAKSCEVLKKLSEIETRGRYQNRSLETA
ncbi:Kae1-associated serine/threonine protein kinase [Candidatus Marsarchaeota archaeon]|jgi:Kae1-associated kinase Bud32|nr:Kae1-associated serine/threonine protein kinase [Candidatus Marsarchaeota archaeon]